MDAGAGAGEFPPAGEAPVYIGFGSMTGFDSARLLDALIEAMSGRRALFHPGWSGIDPKEWRAKMTPFRPGWDGFGPLSKEILYSTTLGQPAKAGLRLRLSRLSSPCYAA
jgi:hypothetical protein